MQKKRKTTLTALLVGQASKPYRQQVEYIHQLIRESRIKPINPKIHNGMNPPLPLHYWRIEETEDRPADLPSSAAFDARISMSYYRSHRSDYKREYPYIEALSNFLKGTSIIDRATENERSFEIWQQEKGFTDGLKLKDGSRLNAYTLLQHCGLDAEKALNIYKIPYPLVSRFVHTEGTALVIENHEPFVKCRDLVTGGKPVFDRAYAGVVFGSGKRITGRFLDINMPEGISGYDYWGDLDREGIRMYLDFSSRSGIPVRLLMPAYRKMIMLAKAMKQSGKRMPEMPKDQAKVAPEELNSLFEADDAYYIRTLWDSGRYIPQEIVKDYV